MLFMCYSTRKALDIQRVVCDNEVGKETDNNDINC